MKRHDGFTTHSAAAMAFFAYFACVAGAFGADPLEANGRKSLMRQFRGDLSDLTIASPSQTPQPDDLDMQAMARAALNYLRGNPDPKRDFECKFSLGPLGIPCQMPLLPPNEDAYDPISLGDTDCRMDWQYAHMREIAGIADPDPVEQGVRKRILGYLGPDHLAWLHPAAWVGPEPVVEGKWVGTWTSVNILFSLAETYARTHNAADAAEAKAIVQALRKLASWDGDRAYYAGGPCPWKDGQWLQLGWASQHVHNYPFIVEPLVRYYECTGDKEGLDLAKAFAEGVLACSQPNQGDQQINPQTGAFSGHVHIHTRMIWGIAHLGALLNEPRYLDWAQRAHDFVVAHGADYGWYPEFIPQEAEYRTEICVVGDMTSIAAWLARGGRPHYWDHVDRALRNELRRSQFFLTPEFLKLFREVNKDKSPAEIDAAIAELRKIEGGFVAQAGFDDWVSYFGMLGKPAVNSNGIDMMGCCPPEGMRAIWETWNSVVEEGEGVVRVNMAISRNHPAADVSAARPEDGQIAVVAKHPGVYQIRPPAWADRGAVQLLRNGQKQEITWGGPASAYVVCPDVKPQERLTLLWDVPHFVQRFEATSIPGQRPRITVRWCGNEVLSVEPRGRYLPMFGKK